MNSKQQQRIARTADYVTGPAMDILTGSGPRKKKIDPRYKRASRNDDYESENPYKKRGK